MNMYVLLVGLHKADIPRTVGVFDSLTAAHLAAEQLYRQVYDKEPQWMNNAKIPHDPDNWSQYVFAVIVEFELNTIHKDIAGDIEAVRDLRSHGMID